MTALAYYEVIFQGKTYKYKRQQDIADAFGISLTMVNSIYKNKYSANTDIKIVKKYDEPKIKKVED